MPEDTPKTVTLAPVADLVDRAFSRFGRLFSGLFPWMVLSCVAGVGITWCRSILPHGRHPGIAWLYTSPWHPALIALLVLIAGIVFLLSNLAEIRIIAGVQGDSHDIMGNARMSAGLFFPYLWIVILQVFIFAGGFVLIGIPSVIFAVYLVLVMFVLVVEGTRGIPALTRSWGYVAGRWWKVLWRFVVLLFLVAVIMAIIGLLFSLLTAPTLPGSAPVLPLSLTFLQQLFEAFLIVPITLCYIYEVYADLRATKPAVAVSDERTARLWLSVFLVIGIVLAALFMYGIVSGGAGGMPPGHWMGR